MAVKRNQAKAGTSRASRLHRVGFFIWRGSLWRKLAVILIGIIILWTVICYGVGRWYMAKHDDEPLVLGTTFIADYAKSFGLSPEQTLKAIFEDLGIRQIRLVSYWKEIEAVPGTYDFSNLDWQFEMAGKYDARVSLAIGLRQPRWPECHEPKWADISAPRNQWQPQLDRFITAVVNRYKDNPSLESYQLENEFFMTVFGECRNFDRDRLVSEYEMVKRLDPDHPIIISRSNNWVGIPVRQPTPDRFGISVYKRVWDATITKRYFEYPLPAWFYASLAGWGEIITGKDMVIHELQAEAWAPNGLTLQEISVQEAYKSLNPERMKARINYGIATGLRQIDLWGVEWWYYLKTVKNDPGVWNEVKAALERAESQNQRLTNH
jgi:hypothetical protein